MQLARSSPGAGFEVAIAWFDDDGGQAAQHCAAVALFSMGQYKEAAGRLEAIANINTKDKNARAKLLAQAGLAWHLDGRLDKALKIQSDALRLAPNSPQILIDRAIVFADRCQ